MTHLTAVAAAVLASLLASPALAQTPRPAPSPGGDLTRMLNGAPPTTATPVPAASTASGPTQPAAPATTPSIPATTESATPAPTAPAAAPAVTTLTAAAIAALPFTVDLPSGFRLTEGRQAPNSRVYAVRRGDRSFVMIYVGDASQFPIYTGETATAAGRESIVVTENGQRRAIEHLFDRPGRTPAQIHVWTTSLEGEDRALAERIAQSVDDR